MDNTFRSYQIEDKSFVAYIKRTIHNEVIACNAFSKTQVAEIDIIIAEMTSNIVKHAGGQGELLYRIIPDPTEGNGPADDVSARLELICIDSGPGIHDTQRMMKDGVTTTNTLGGGLGAMLRLSTFFQIYSLPGWGTVLISVVDSKRRRNTMTRLTIDVQALCVHKPRESVCGDGYRVKRTGYGLSFFLGDGLGHGPHANEAITKAGEFFMATEEQDPVLIIREMHEKVRRTRGLVATVAVYEAASKLWRICGVGNISTRLYTGITYKNYMSYNGAVGLTIPNSLRESVFPADRHQHLVMTSDGIRSRWELGKYPSILKYDSRLMAAVLYKDFNRGNDDTSVVVAKVN